MLEAKPRSWFSWDYRVLDAGREVGGFNLAWLREGGALLVGAEKCPVRREGLWGDWILDWRGREVARATKPSSWSRRFLVRFGGREIELVPPHVFTRSFAAREGGRTVGEIAPAGIFTRRTRIDLPSDVPLPVQVFMLFLVILMWRRAAQSSDSG